jgi:hypothetical protein
LVLVLLLAGLAALAGCAQSAATPMPETVIVERQAEHEAAPPMEAPVAQDTANAAGAAGLPSVADRMIIRTGDLSLEVEDAEAALGQIRSLVARLDGFVAGTNMWQVDDRMRGTVTLRVPAESFDAAMEQVKDLAVEVHRENVAGQDVTEEFTDLDARLRNLEATEQELLALLTEVREETRRAEDVLAVHRELTDIRGQIEQIKGRMQYLERSTALATINVELIPQEEVQIVEAGWQPNQTLREALRALVNAGQFLVDAAIWLIVFALPVLLALLAPIVIVVVLLRRWQRARRARGTA